MLQLANIRFDHTKSCDLFPQITPNLSGYRLMSQTPRTAPPEPETRPKTGQNRARCPKTAPLISETGYRFPGSLRIRSGGVAGSVPTTYIDLLSTKIIPRKVTYMIQYAKLRAKSKHCGNGPHPYQTAISSSILLARCGPLCQR